MRSGARRVEGVGQARQSAAHPYPPETGSSSDSFSALASADGGCDHGSKTSASEETPAADRLSDRVRGTRHRTHGLRHCLHEARNLRRRANARGACMVGTLLPARATPRSGAPRSLRARDWRRRARPLRERHTHSRGSLRARRAIRRTDHQARRPCDASEAARGSTSDCRRPPRPRFERHARDRGLVSALRPSAGSLDPTAPAAELALSKTSCQSAFTLLAAPKGAGKGRTSQAGQHAYAATAETSCSSPATTLSALRRAVSSTDDARRRACSSDAADELAASCRRGGRCVDTRDPA